MMAVTALKWEEKKYMKILKKMRLDIVKNQLRSC